MSEGDRTVIDVSGVRRTFSVKDPGGLRRSTRVLAAVDDVTFAVTRGECIGYIGANGAGKSTMIKMLSGILTPTAGRVRVCGLDPVPQRSALARRIGVVFGQRSQLWWDLPLLESFRILGAIHRIGPAAFEARLAECVGVLELDEFLGTPVRQLSLGQRMRGEIAAALLHSPELLVLDEPTIGLDILSRERVRSFLSKQIEQGVTVLLATHDLPDVERLCSRLLVVDRGHLGSDGTLTDLSRRVGAARVLVVDFHSPQPALDDVPHTSLRLVEADGLRQHLAFLGDVVSAADVVAAVSARASIRDLTLREPDINEVVRALYESR
jgi:ABC-2 type transport system ATP-binding protein